MLCRSRLRPRPAELPAQGYQGGGGKPPEAFARYTPPPRAGPGPLVVSSSFSCVLSSCGPSVGERHGGRSRRGKDEAPLGTVCDWWDIQGSAANSVCVYDPQADAWTQLASMVTARRLHASAAVGGKLYVFGGYTRVAPRGLSARRRSTTLHRTAGRKRRAGTPHAILLWRLLSERWHCHAHLPCSSGSDEDEDDL